MAVTGVAIPEARIAAYRVSKRRALRLALQQQYSADPYHWCVDRLGGYVYAKLQEVWQSVVDNRRTAVPSAHETGKSWSAARIAAWWIDTHPPGEAFVLTTASTAAQVRAVLWKEIRRAHREGKLEGRLNQTEWWLNDEMVGLGRKPADYDPTAFQGIHAKYVLVIVDEGCGVPEEIFTAALSLIANEHGRILVLGNPDDSQSHFAKICKPGSGWNVVHISAYDTPNFTGEDAPQAVKDVLVNPIYIEELKHDVGEDSPVFISKALGQFPDDVENGVVSLAWVRACQRIDKEVEEYEAELAATNDIALGVDVGAGGDETVIRERRGKLAGRNWRHKTPDARDAVAHVANAIKITRASVVNVDNIGVGWGIVGGLRTLVDNGEFEHEVVINAVDVRRVEGIDTNRFPKLRDAMWWEIGRELSRNQGWDLRNVDDVTVAQLIAPTWSPDSTGRHKIEAKAETKKRLNGRSPDDADALLLAYYVPAPPPPPKRSAWGAV